MIQIITEMFSYPFMLRAVIVGVLVSLCAALLGTSLVLKRYSMIGDGLSHVGFAALAVAYVTNLAPLTVAIPICVFSAFLLLRMNENSKIKGDAATALMCSGALAVGVMTVSVTTGMNTDVCNYMFGSILAMSPADVKISVILSAAVIILFVAFYPRIFAVTFDENFAKATGTNSNLYNMIIALLTAVTVVLGMRMMGTLLISSLIVFPSLSSMRICKKFKTVIISSVFVSIVCFLTGIFISYEYSTPTGASIVIINIIVFLVFSLIERGREHVQNEK
ncbi:metal ABC transporter permease [Aminipila luticellarii]|uniref:Metal ABC transporter permease n=1 Tax=Aminipila luticellarii TaxID=2507160 RepID=A0A410PVI8_9FIRM|nr:metal ABC transporter permease [Aminipila luticellarii]QAT42934.1 metal ABC transporter permease [Aminipila luticellarii]